MQLAPELDPPEQVPTATPKVPRPLPVRMEKPGEVEGPTEPSRSVTATAASAAPSLSKSAIAKAVGPQPEGRGVWRRLKKKPLFMESKV